MRWGTRYDMYGTHIDNRIKDGTQNPLGLRQGQIVCFRDSFDNFLLRRHLDCFLNLCFFLLNGSRRPELGGLCA